MSELKSEADSYDCEAETITNLIDEQKSYQLEALREIASYQSSNYLEKKARDSYNLIKDGDLIIEIKTVR